MSASARLPLAWPTPWLLCDCVERKRVYSAPSFACAPFCSGPTYCQPACPPASCNIATSRPAASWAGRQLGKQGEASRRCPSPLAFLRAGIAADGGSAVTPPSATSFPVLRHSGPTPAGEAAQPAVNGFSTPLPVAAQQQEAQAAEGQAPAAAQQAAPAPPLAAAVGASPDNGEPPKPPPHPASYMEVLEMLEKGQTPPGIRVSLPACLRLQGRHRRAAEEGAEAEAQAAAARMHPMHPRCPACPSRVVAGLARTRRAQPHTPAPAPLLSRAALASA